METNTMTNTLNSAIESGPDVIETVETIAVNYGMKALGALVILVLGLWAAKLLKKVVVRLMRRSKVDETLIAFVASLAHVTLQIFVIIAALEKLDVKTTSFVAMLGAAGLAVGLALQGSLAEFCGGRTDDYLQAVHGRRSGRSGWRSRNRSGNRDLHDGDRHLRQ